MSGRLGRCLCVGVGILVCYQLCLSCHMWPEGHGNSGAVDGEAVVVILQIFSFPIPVRQPSPKPSKPRSAL